MFFYSTIEPIYYLLPLAGFVIGLFGTMLGGGGGYFFLPILTLLVGVPAQVAVITSLVASLPVCAVGAAGHYLKTNIDLRKGMSFAIAGIAGAFIGAGITSLISPQQLKISFGIYSVLIAIQMAWTTRQKKKKELNETSMATHASKENVNNQPCEFHQTNNLDKFFTDETRMVTSLKPPLFHKAKGSSFGLLAGVITGTFGTSGTAPVLAGLFSMELPLKTVVGTSLMVVLVNTFFAVGAHFLVGQIDLSLVIFLTAGSIIGALLGPVILPRIKTDKSEHKIKYFYAMGMIVIGVLMITG